MTPLAAVSVAAASGRLPKDSGAPPLLDHPAVVAGTLALAAGELGGDKMRSAPDRSIAPGSAARVMTGAIAGAAQAPPRHRLRAGARGAGAAG
ncbi:hypothetical protein [Sphingomonas sp.]|uniref:hypothetical protein n=1 Tax=Sphingomonas sp. TaxID=28214 RepID=UPI003B3BBDE1